MADLSIAQIEQIPCAGFKSLLEESLVEGHSCLERLRTEWHDGLNRFDKQGEFYLGVYLQDRLAGLGGLSIDPYARQDGVGRVRHLFVLKQYRRSGIATAIIQDIIRRAVGAFDTLHLRIPKNSETADAFYLSQGFHRLTGDDFCTHWMDLRKAGTQI